MKVIIGRKSIFGQIKIGMSRKRPRGMISVKQARGSCDRAVSTDGSSWRDAHPIERAAAVQAHVNPVVLFKIPPQKLTFIKIAPCNSNYNFINKRP